MISDIFFESLNLGVEIKLVQRSKDKQVYYVKDGERYGYYLKVYDTKKYDIYALERLSKLLQDNDVACSKIEIVSCNEKYGLIREEKCKGFCLAESSDENFGKIMHSVGNKIAALNSIRLKKAEDIIPILELKSVCAKEIYKNIFNYINIFCFCDEKDRLFYSKCKQMIEEELRIDECYFSHNDLNLFHIFSFNSMCSGLIDFDMLSRGGAHLNISQVFFSIINTKFEIYGADLLAGYNEGLKSYKKCSVEMIVSYLWVYLMWKITVCINHDKKDALDFYNMKLI